jgi:hypothetical protein
MTIRQDVDALKGWNRRGDWLVSDRHGIARLVVPHGMSYSLYRWDYIGDWFAELIGVRGDLESALRLIPQETSDD